MSVLQVVALGLFFFGGLALLAWIMSGSDHKAECYGGKGEGCGFCEHYGGKCSSCGGEHNEHTPEGADRIQRNERSIRTDGGGRVRR